MTEVPEMFGAERLLMSRATDKKTFDKIITMINGFKNHFTSHGESVAENPSPGNREGGITTLEEKSLGCVQKGGNAPVCGVIGYGERIIKQGLTLLDGPGNDIVACTALAAAGAHIILFTTGRGTPLGSPVPVIKISSNTALADKKPGWIDYDAGKLVENKNPEQATDELFDLIISAASGNQTKNEHNGYYDFAIWRGGVTL
jgi:altronate hydrolase